MPELPEVETITRGLRQGVGRVPSIIGHNIENAHVYWARTVEEPGVKIFTKRIKGQVVEDIYRRGKFILFQLSQNTMLVHLRMSGDLRVGKKDEILGDHIRLRLDFEDNLQLAFNNPRKFGRVWLVADPEIVVGELGPEPFSPQLDGDGFYALLSRRKRQLKSLLMDQTFLAGLGNIYTDEALNLAKLHPQTLSNIVTPSQAEKLLNAIRVVLEEGIHRNGASIDWVYQGGDFQNHFRVYQRTGEPCPDCGTMIERIIVGQRGTHYCPACQIRKG
jgi:formamidopyrimidine-DNA glycosylase